jgi:F-type H+-transporting ATPase subunit b
MVSIDIDWSLGFQIVNFLVLMFVLNLVLYKPIRGILAQRAEKIAQMNGEIASSLEGVDNKNKALEAERANARTQGASLREEIKAAGRTEERELVGAATKEMEEAVARVRAEIAKEIGGVRDQLKAEVQTFGRDLAQKILGRSIQ